MPHRLPDVRDLSPAQTLAFLTEGAPTAKVATTLRDGTPHVVPVWFVIDHGKLVFTTWHESVKGRSLRRDSRIAICVDDERPPYAFVSIGGHASISEDPGQRARFVRLIAARYMGPERTADIATRNDVEGELVITVTLDHVLARAELAD